MGSYRVHRGGCWIADAGACRSAFRSCDVPGLGFFNHGLRVSLVPADK